MISIIRKVLYDTADSVIDAETVSLMQNIKNIQAQPVSESELLHQSFSSNYATYWQEK